MKKSIFIMVFVSLFVNTTYCQSSGGNGGMEWGVLSKGCTGGGLCKITHEPTKTAYGNFDYLPEEGVILLQVNKANISEELFNHKVDDLYFRQLEPILVDPVLCRKIGTFATIQVQKGNFLVTESKDGKKYIIHLRVKELD